MQNRSVLGVLAAAVMVPGAAAAQGLAINHDAIGCIVAGKYPKLNACFDPTSSVARARVFFRGGGGLHWYFVDMRSDAPCFSGVLPKPKPSLDTIDYYVEVVDKTFAESRTSEYHPQVVDSEGECRKDVPVAPGLGNATVTVGAAAGAPAVPAGFSSAGIVGAGGLSTGVVAAGVVGVGAAAAGVAVAVSGGDDPTTTTMGAVLPTLPPTTAAPTTTTPTPTTITLPPTPFKPFLVVTPSPAVGPPPLQVTFNACGSTGQSLKFFYDYNADGSNDYQGPCQSKVDYTIDGFSLFGVAAQAPPTMPGCRTFCYDVCVYNNKGTVNEEFECFEGCVFVCPDAFVEAGAEDPVRRLAWASELEVPGASAQVVVNGDSAVFAAAGRSVAAVPGKRGENRVEAQLVQAAGRPGTWRFDLSTTASLDVGSLRVIAGEVVAISGDAVVFRLTGRPGERVVFAFRTRR